MRPSLLRAAGRGGLFLVASLVGGAVLAIAPDARAISPDEAIDSAQRSIAQASASTGDVERAIANSKADERSPQARIADGELFLRSKDYDRAANVFSQVIEKYKDDAQAYPDALFLLGETYYASKQYLSARRTYRTIVDHAGENRFAIYQGKALARLVDVALRVHDYSTLDEVFAKMNQLPSSAIEGGIQYAHGKGLFAKKDYAAAKAALASVNVQSGYAHQAKYLLGVIAMKEVLPPATKDAKQPEVVSRGRYAAAIDQFRQVTQLPPDTDEHRHVIDLAWMAIGRLFNESDQFFEAADAYNHVDRTSPEFGTMLYELAWVYVRMGDADRAQRALEVLAVADPDSSYLADGSLLRADLMLRAGQFEKSLQLYQNVRAQFDPMRDKVQAFLDSTSDPAVYYDKLAKEQLESIEQGALLPPITIQWAREAENGPAAFAVIDDVKSCRELLRHTTTLVERLTALLNAPNKVRAFPELRAGEEKALALLNGISMARFTIAQGLDKEEEDVSSELAAVQAERRKLQARLEYLPVSDGDFAQRDEQAQHQWNSVSQKIQQLTLQVDQLQAIVNGLRRALAEGPQQGVVRDPASVRQFEAELAQNEHDLGVYRSEIDELRKMIDAGKMQVGFGDQRFVEDADVRAAYRRALGQEVQLAGAGQGGKKAIAYAQRAQTVLVQADAAEQKLQALYDELEQRVQKRADELRATIDVEVANVQKYTAQLDALDSEARLVVGQVAMKNFGLVKDKLRNIVLRADVGVTEEAWELREEEMTRVRNLQLERARSEQQLNEELREVLDDMGDNSSAPAGGNK